MGSLVPDVGLNLKVYAFESVLKETIEMNQIEEVGDAKAAKLEGFIRNLEVERGKIEVFQRELPLSVHLLSDVIEWLKEQLERCQKAPVFEELMPMKSKFEEDGGMKVQNDAKDKMDWLSSVQLWSHGDREQKNDDTTRKIQNNKPSQVSTSGAVMQFQNFSRKKEERVEMDQSLLSFKGVNIITANNSDCFSNQIRIQSQQRKTRRSWSPELHRRFVSALQQLGGAQVATPKQIRELMKVDGLTNDEVKSHLQKYRLHCRKMPKENATCKDKAIDIEKDLWLKKPKEQNYTSSQQSTSQSCSPTGPLQFTICNGGAVSFTAGESCEIDEDGRSESYGFK